VLTERIRAAEAEVAEEREARGKAEGQREALAQVCGGGGGEG
jgi:hypothetical protein